MERGQLQPASSSYLACTLSPGLPLESVNCFHQTMRHARGMLGMAFRSIALFSSEALAMTEP
jgi:hypothetical protein